MPVDALANIAKHAGRIEIADPAEVNSFELRISENTLQQIRQIEESLLTAEERLGTFRVG